MRSGLLMVIPATTAGSLDDADDRGFRVCLGAASRPGLVGAEVARRVRGFGTTLRREVDGVEAARRTRAFLAPASAGASGGRGISRFTCDASLSSRKPSNDAWRTKPSCVHSAKVTSATSW